jgi:hypothetical protein
MWSSLVDADFHSLLYYHKTKACLTSLRAHEWLHYMKITIHIFLHNFPSFSSRSLLSDSFSAFQHNWQILVGYSPSGYCFCITRVRLHNALNPTVFFYSIPGLIVHKLCTFLIHLPPNTVKITDQLCDLQFDVRNSKVVKPIQTILQYFLIITIFYKGLQRFRFQIWKITSKEPFANRSETGTE